MARKKHKPQRTCVACREVENKQDLIRIVRTPEGVFVDPSGKLPGRGAYLHPRETCWEKGLDSALEAGLRTSLTEEDRKRLEGYLQKLRDE